MAGMLGGIKAGIKAQVQNDKQRRLENTKAAMVNEFALELKSAATLLEQHECALRVSRALAAFDTWSEKHEMTRGRIKEQTSRVRAELEAALNELWQDARRRADDQMRLQELSGVEQALANERNMRLLAEQQALDEANRRLTAEKEAQSAKDAKKGANARAASAKKAQTAAEQRASELDALVAQEAAARLAAQEKEAEMQRKLNAELEHKKAMAAWLASASP